MTIDTIFKNIYQGSSVEMKDKIIEFLINIYTNFMKSKEYSTIVYTNFRSTLENLKNIISLFTLVGKL